MEPDNREGISGHIGDGHEQAPIIFDLGALRQPEGERQKLIPRQKTFIDRLRKPIPVFTLLLTIVAIIQCWVTWRQLGAMNTQLDEMKSNSVQTDTLLRQNLDQIKALQETNRLTEENSRARIERKDTQIDK